jgi:hypothetical protein
MSHSMVLEVQLKTVSDFLFIQFATHPTILSFPLLPDIQIDLWQLLPFG